MSRLLAVLAALQLATGAAFAFAHLGVLPLYGDTPEYLRSSDTREIRGVRGFLYPYLLDGVARAVRTPRDPEYPGRRPVGSRDRPATQLAQLAIYVASVSYFVWAVVGAPARGRRDRLRIALVVGLLAAEPVALHLAFSILPDSLALSACLAACAAFADLVRGRVRPGVSAGLLALSCAVASGLRVEKGAVLALAALGSAAGYAWLGRRGGAPASSARRVGAAVVLVLATAVACQCAQSRLTEPLQTSRVELLLGQRVVYPHLARSYDALPAIVQARIRPDEAERHDTSIRSARDVFEKASGGDTELRHRLLVESAQVVFARRWPLIGADIAKDTLENALPSASFYARVGAWHVLGGSAFLTRFRGDGTHVTWGRMSWALPALAPVHVGSAAALLLACFAATVARMRRPAGYDWPGADAARRWLPALCLSLANALAFALLQDMSAIRYALFAHVACLAFLYDAALRGVAVRADSAQ